MQNDGTNVETLSLKKPKQKSKTGDNFKFQDG